MCAASHSAHANCWVFLMIWMAAFVPKDWFTENYIHIVLVSFHVGLAMRIADFTLDHVSWQV